MRVALLPLRWCKSRISTRPPLELGGTVFHYHWFGMDLQTPQISTDTTGLGMTVTTQGWKSQLSAWPSLTLPWQVGLVWGPFYSLERVEVWALHCVSAGGAWGEGYNFVCDPPGSREDEACKKLLQSHLSLPFSSGRLSWDSFSLLWVWQGKRLSALPPHQ